MPTSSEDINLDPKDWEEFETIGHDIIELLVEYHKSVRDKPVWQPIPDDVKRKFTEPIPSDGVGPNKAIEEFKKYILPYPTGNIHPRFWGWVHGTGTSFGALAELLAAMMNPNTGGREHIANYVERQVLDWGKQMLQYDEQATGILTSGCSMANLTGLTVARNVKAGYDVRKYGLQNIEKPMTIYGSEELHSSNQKAIEVLGLGSNALRIIETNDKYQINLDALQEKISEDRDNGFHPICIIGNAGTVNTGAIDDLEGIAKLAEKEDMWFHIDGAFGAVASIVPEYREKLSGLKLADSIAFDMHKWMYMPYEIGVALIRHPDHHKSTFSLRPDYLSQMQRGLASFENWPTEYGVELSRGFRALKAWLSLKESGINKYSKVVEKNIMQARYFADLVEKSEKLELMAPQELNVVCFRYVFPDVDNTRMEELNQEILLRVQESGKAVFSSTYLKGTYTLRIAITNQRSNFSDFDILFDTVTEIGDKIVEEEC